MNKFKFALTVLTLLANGAAFAAVAPTFNPMPQSGQTAPLAVTITADCSATSGVTYTCSCDNGLNNCTSTCPVFPATGTLDACGTAQVVFTGNTSMQAYNNNTGEALSLQDYVLNIIPALPTVSPVVVGSSGTAKISWSGPNPNHNGWFINVVSANWDCQNPTQSGTFELCSGSASCPIAPSSPYTVSSLKPNTPFVAVVASRDSYGNPVSVFPNGCTALPISGAPGFSPQFCTPLAPMISSTTIKKFDFEAIPPSVELTVGKDSNGGAGGFDETIRIVEICTTPDIKWPGFSDYPGCQSKVVGPGQNIQFTNLVYGQTYYVQEMITDACGNKNVMQSPPTPIQFTVPGQVPYISDLTPHSVVAGGPSFLLKITDTATHSFIPTDRVFISTGIYWNGDQPIPTAAQELSSVFISSSEFDVQISSSLFNIQVSTNQVIPPAIAVWVLAEHSGSGIVPLWITAPPPIAIMYDASDLNGGGPGACSGPLCTGSITGPGLVSLSVDPSSATLTVLNTSGSITTNVAHQFEIVPPPNTPITDNHLTLTFSPTTYATLTGYANSNLSAQYVADFSSLFPSQPQISYEASTNQLSVLWSSPTYKSTSFPLVGYHLKVPGGNLPAVSSSSSDLSGYPGFSTWDKSAPLSISLTIEAYFHDAQNREFDFDLLVSSTIAISTTPVIIEPAVIGTIVNTTTNTITAVWNLTSFANVAQLQAGTTDSAGAPLPISNSDLLSPPFSVPIPSITVHDLPVPNTSYTLTLIALNNGSLELTPYAGSQVVGITHAAIPATPDGNFFGTAGNVSLHVTMNPDANAADSRYVIRISSNNQTTQFLNGSGGLVDIPTPMTRVEWQTAPASTTLVNAGLATLFQIAIGVIDRASTLEFPQNIVYSNSITKSGPGALITVNFPTFNGPSYDDYIFGVNLSGPFSATFSTDMDPSVVAGVALKDLRSGTTVPLTTTYDAPSQTLALTPVTSLLPAHPYELTISSGLQDHFGFTTQQSFSQVFVTGLDPKQQVTFFSPYDSTQTDGVTVNANSLASGWFVVPRPAAFLISPKNFVSATPNVLQSGLGTAQNLIPLNQAEALIFGPGPVGPTQNDAPTPVSLTLSARGRSAGTPALAGPLDPAAMGIYFLDTSGGPPRLVAVQGSQNNGASVTAPITKSGIYILAGRVSTSLSSAYAWPVPYKPAEGHTLIHFVGLAPGSAIKVYTIMGEGVAELYNTNNETELTWNVTNKDGETVGSGIYVYQIKNAISEKRGKLMIIR